MSNYPKKIPWMYNEAFHPFYEKESDYELTAEDLIHLENHQQK